MCACLSIARSLAHGMWRFLDEKESVLRASARRVYGVAFGKSNVSIFQPQQKTRLLENDNDTALQDENINNSSDITTRGWWF